VKTTDELLQKLMQDVFPLSDHLVDTASFLRDEVGKEHWKCAMAALLVLNGGLEEYISQISAEWPAEMLEATNHALAGIATLQILENIRDIFRQSPGSAN